MVYFSSNSTCWTAAICLIIGTGELIIRSRLAQSIGEQVLSAMKERAKGSKASATSKEDNSLDRLLEEEEELLEEDPLDTHLILQRILEHEFWGKSFGRIEYCALTLYCAEPYHKQGELSPSTGLILLTAEPSEGGISTGETSVGMG